MNKENIARLLAEVAGIDNIKIDEFMKYHTSFKVGGPADIFIMPESIESLVKIYHKCLDENLKVFVFGNGSNLIVRDKGIRGVVVKMGENTGRYTVLNDVIKAEAGIGLARLSKIALENGLAGLEFAEGIPGTLGGAVAMNAGAYDGEMADVVFRTEYMDKKGAINILEGKDHEFGKRSSRIQTEQGLVLRSEIELKNGDINKIKAKMDDFNRQRKDKQPLEMPSAGSIFKRPEGYFAGKLIQDCGLKGYSIGGAEVSCKHCGFIVNKGNATARDIIDLIEYIQKAVKEKFGVELNTEVKIVGEE